IPALSEINSAIVQNEWIRVKIGERRLRRPRPRSWQPAQRPQLSRSVGRVGTDQNHPIHTIDQLAIVLRGIGTRARIVAGNGLVESGRSGEARVIANCYFNRLPVAAAIAVRKPPVSALNQ